MKTSPLFNINLYDVIKGLIVTAGGAAMAVIENSLQTGSLAFNWKQIGMTALAAGVAYLAKNFFTPAQTILKQQGYDQRI
jgi:hypothetical protein